MLYLDRAFEGEPCLHVAAWQSDRLIQWRKGRTRQTLERRKGGRAPI